MHLMASYVSVYYNNSTWTDIVAKLKIDAKEFIVAHIDDIMSDIKNREEVDEVGIDI